MVKIKELKNKNGELLKTKEGEVLKVYTLEKGDEFLPQMNKVIRKVNPNDKSIVNYKILAKVRDVNNKISEDEEVFIDLTPTQAKTIQDKLDKDDLITEKIFTAYEYYHEQREKTYIGVGYKAKPYEKKTFDDIEQN